MSERATLAASESPYLEDFRSRAGDGPGHLAELRRRGIEAFAARGFPGPREEAWRKLDLSPVTGRHHPPAAAAGTPDPALLERLESLGEGPRLVFVDGRLAPQLCRAGQDTRGVFLGALSQLGHGGETPQGLTQALGSVAGIEGHPFAALNSAFLEDAALVHLGRGAMPEAPLQMAFITSAAADGQLVCPRILVVAEASAAVRLAEVYLSTDQSSALVCPVTEVLAGQGSSVELQRFQEEGSGVRHLAVSHLELAQEASVTLNSVAVGAALGRLDAFAELRGTGADATLNGLALTAGRQVVDHHTWVRHRCEHGTSRQLFKGVLRGRSETFYDGLVHVAEGARKTDAQQQNRNLLLDRMALAHSNPRLEIHNDDVKCAHGSTVGELDDEALFYLRSRGIGPEDAQALLTYAFANEVLAGIRPERLQNHARELLLARLPGDATLREIR